ncbi:MAG: beta-N-acetylhexosaminidase [Chitinophagaceae bacterium]|nr:beta-N-acetylhexosaminidase [Chitinophagaceae bacterium]MCW5928292.1 beta-N-acetylhexosaminidase [Chitinophagaceae bacterium]
MRLNSHLILLTFHLLLAQICFGTTTVNLIPWPAQIDIKNDKITINRHLLFINVANKDEVEQVIKTCSNDLKDMGFQIVGKSPASNSRSLKIAFSLLDPGDDQLGDEGYQLIIDDKISIVANTAKGLFWGSRTVLQLLQKGPGASIPKLEISDQPVSKYRGLMIDVARNFHSLDFHLETIKRIASYKINHYMIHFSDQQSYTLPSDKYPALPTAGRSYSKDDIRKMVALAKEYHVNIVPSVDVPGHSGAIIQKYPNLAFNKDTYRLDATKDETINTLQNIFGELMELFLGPIWHLGADEVHYPDLKESPTTVYTEWMMKHNYSKGGQVLNHFINQMYDFFKGKGYQMFVWEGFQPNIFPKVNTEITVCPFDIKFEGIMPIDYIEAGYTLINTSWTPLYIADRIDMSTPDLIAKWNINMFGKGRAPQPFHYWMKYRPEEIKTEIVGGQMCSWAIEEKAEWGLLFGKNAGPGFPEYGIPAPRIQVFSERVWTGSKTSETDLLERTGASHW